MVRVFSDESLRDTPLRYARLNGNCCRSRPQHPHHGTRGRVGAWYEAMRIDVSVGKALQRWQRAIANLGNASPSSTELSALLSEDRKGEVELCLPCASLCAPSLCM